MNKQLKEYILNQLDSFVGENYPEYQKYASGRKGGGVTYRWKFNKEIHFFLILQFLSKHDNWLISGAWTKNGKMPKEITYMQTMQGMRSCNDDLSAFWKLADEAWLSPGDVSDRKSNAYDIEPLTDRWIEKLLEAKDPYFQLQEEAWKQAYQEFPDDTKSEEEINDEIKKQLKDNAWSDASSRLNTPLLKDDLGKALGKAIEESKETLSAFVLAYQTLISSPHNC